MKIRDIIFAALIILMTIAAGTPFQTFAEFEETAVVVYTENRELKTDLDTENLFPEFNSLMPGHTFHIRLKLENRFKGDYDYVGFYIKPTADAYVPKTEAEQIIDRLNRLKQEKKKLEEEMDSQDQQDEDFFEAYIVPSLEIDRQIRQAFTLDDVPEEEKALIHALRQLEIMIETEESGTADASLETVLDPSQLIRIGRLDGTGPQDCTLTVAVPENISEEDLEALRKVRWGLSACPQYEYVSVRMEAEITNLPEDGLYVPEKLDEYGMRLAETDENGNEIYPENDYVAYDIRVYNEGNTSFSYAQIRGIGSDGAEFDWYDRDTYAYRFDAGTNVRPIELGRVWLVTAEDAERGSGEIRYIFEGIPDNPDIREHYIAEVTISFKAHFEDTETQADAVTTEEISEMPDKPDENEGNEDEEKASSALKVWIPVTAGAGIIVLCAGCFIKRRREK